MARTLPNHPDIGEYISESSDPAALALDCLLRGDTDQARVKLALIEPAELGYLEATLAEMRVLVTGAYNRASAL